MRVINRPEKVVCIGVDLAWSDKNKTGISILELQPKEQTLDLFREPDWVLSDDDILRIIKQVQSDCIIIAIDAPIIAPNKPGTGRLCDREVSKAFGKYEAGAYPANREKCKRPIKLRQLLAKRGFSPNPYCVEHKPGLWQIEVYPHPAQVVLFGLTKTLKYKKGPRQRRKEQLKTLGDNILSKLNKHLPRLQHNKILREVCDTTKENLWGRKYKEREDVLDSIICGYIAAYYWTWREEKCNIFGDPDSGYIITPKPPET